MSFSLEEEEELEGGGSAEFTCFSEDLVAEQLTYMDAVRLRCVSQMCSHLKHGAVTALVAQRVLKDKKLEDFLNPWEAVPVYAELKCDLNQSSE